MILDGRLLTILYKFCGSDLFRIPAIQTEKSMKKLLGFILFFALNVCAQAQTFKMPCDVSGTVPAMEDKKLPPEHIVVEIQSLGKNLFLKIPNSKLYSAQVSSLETEEFSGKNLTNPKQMGAHRKNKLTAKESEIRIERDSRILFGYNDTVVDGQAARIYFQGPCTPPTN